MWWTKSATLDQQIRDDFAADHSAIMVGKRQSWLETARGRLAYVIVLDQFSRNMFRDSAKMYDADERALAAVLEGVERGHDAELAIGERIMFYMPTMHTEDLAGQERGVQLFAALADGVKGTAAHTRVNRNYDYAIKHRDIVKEWGRFPHRNKLLGRETTPEEAEFLKKPGSSF